MRLSAALDRRAKVVEKLSASVVGLRNTGCVKALAHGELVCVEVHVTCLGTGKDSAAKASIDD